MTLTEWLSRPNPDGSKRKRIDLAAKIGVTPSMITDYCEGRSWPRREIMQAIVAATDGDVTPNDFLQNESAP